MPLLKTASWNARINASGYVHVSLLSTSASVLYIPRDLEPTSILVERLIHA